ncbi:conserved hypothetical protein [Paenibacillus curdlanolyticus YK9]|uniref:Uncharacterized protein n=1 Tax=Paenibacillus curdlanolyticus YK9 TaxID=717606 RepID=E0I672_9BACL|nr:DUF5995 family protein [Paenibacillus curdlanolyticus]EFM12464.1 conserved hypothetical protein [Paenibacillus curdlanolyticus YK9]
MSTLNENKQYGHAQTIDEVLEQLDEIIAKSIDNASQIGYFAALYRMVTAQVKIGIANGQFENGPRMEQLDVRFANRYLQAYSDYCNGKPCSDCWRFAFEAAEQSGAIVMQHLLVGMNAHINYDLGIAAAETCTAEPLEHLHHDFNTINDILASLTDEVKRDIDTISPWIGWLDRLGGRTTDVIIRFSMDKARSYAWTFATEVSHVQGTAREALLRSKDAFITELAREVLRPPGWLLRSALWLIRLRESKDVAGNIRLLNETKAAGVQVPPIPPAGGPLSV